MAFNDFGIIQHYKLINFSVISQQITYMTLLSSSSSEPHRPPTGYRHAGSIFRGSATARTDNGCTGPLSIQQRVPHPVEQSHLIRPREILEEDIGSRRSDVSRSVRLKGIVGGHRYA